MITKTYSQDLSGKNTFRMKVSCRCFIEYDSISDLFDLDFEDMFRPVRHIGAGSNILFTDDFKGTLLHSKVRFIEELNDDGLVSVGAGTVFDDFCEWAAGHGFWGPENLSGIPGETGAAAVQNIGAYGVEVKDIIEAVYCYDLEEEDMVHFSAGECGYGYRESIFKDESNKGRYIVTHVVFRLGRNAAPKLEYGSLKDLVAPEDATPSAVRKAVIEIRRNKLPDPAEIGSAGSFFKNPVVSADILANVQEKAGKDIRVPYFTLPDGQVKIPAAFLIEQCGWKGRRSGNAAVYDKQPLVIVNATGQAAPEEIVALENKVRASVRQKFGIELQAEVEHF